MARPRRSDTHMDLTPADRAMLDQLNAAAFDQHDLAADRTAIARADHPLFDVLIPAYMDVQLALADPDKWCSHMVAALSARRPIPAHWHFGSSQLRCLLCFAAYMDKLGSSWCDRCAKPRSRCVTLSVTPAGAAVTSHINVCRPCAADLGDAG